MKRLLRNITDFFKINGKFIIFLLPVVLHQMTLLENPILLNTILVIVLWCSQKYIFSVYKYEDKKIDYAFFGFLIFYLSYVESGFLFFSGFITLYFIYQKVRLKKYGALGLYCLGAMVSVGLCFYQYDLSEGIGFIQNLGAYAYEIILSLKDYVLQEKGHSKSGLSPKSFTDLFLMITCWIFFWSIFIVRNFQHQFYMVLALLCFFLALATETQNLFFSGTLIGLSSFYALWKIEKHLT